MQCIAVLLASAIALVASSSVNYCGSRMCANTNAHTFCQFPEGPSHECVGYISVPLTMEEKARVIARLNRRRNEAAAGRLRGFPSAGDMLKLRWVEELAREAQRWADQCRPPRTPEEHDACRDLYSLSVGQCVASVVGEAPGLRVESMVDIWYMQSISYKGNITFYVPPSHNSSFYGDFAQIMWAQSYMVGCGRSRFMTPWQGRLRSVERLVCNIAPLGPPPARPLWTPAAPAVSCPSRSQQDTVMQALCDYQWNPKEITVVDPTMTLEEHLLLDTVLEIEKNYTLDYIGSLDEIYLTKLTIATMVNTITTETAYFNSMQRRDVVEVIEDIMPEWNISVISNTTAPLEVVLPTINTLPTEEETTTVKAAKTTTKKRVSLIGRPKSYNMEDLTGLDEKTENKTPIEEISKREKDFYAEYEYSVDGSTVSTTLDVTNTSGMVNILINQDVLRDVETRLYQNSSMLYGGPLHTFIDNAQSGVLSMNNSSVADVTDSATEFTTASVNDNIDEYLSDPETVRELQEALDRIEDDMAQKGGKVRRELRDPSESTSFDKPLIDALHSADLERNNSLEKGVMYNMVLKYMPYLKQYEGSILPKSNDSSRSSLSSRVSILSIVIVLVFPTSL